MAESIGSLDELLRRELTEAVRALPESGPLAAALRKSLRRPEVTLDTVAQLRADAEAIAALLGGVADRVGTAERAQAAQDPFGPAWWSATRRLLAAQVDDVRYRQLWATTWAEALAADRYDRADQLADLALRSDDRVRERMREVTTAFTTGRRADALPALAGLAGDGLTAAVTVSVTVLRARIHLRVTGDTSAAEHAARDAVSAAESDGPDALGLALAVLAETHLERGETDLAEQALDRTRQLRAAVADPLVVAGTLAERRGAWRQADELYDEAGERAGERAARPGLMCPRPPNLGWRVARGLLADHPDLALTLVQDALRRGVVGAGRFPDRRALLDKGQILTALGRVAEAAEAYGDAAARYAASGLLARAVGLYELACELAPDSAELRWSFADALRIQTEDDDTVVDIEQARRAYGLLRAGYAFARPGRPHAWVLTTEALLAYALADADADPHLLLERSLLLDDGSARVHASMATLLRLDGYPAEAEPTARRACELDRRDPVVADVLATVLTDRGDDRGALEVIDTFPGGPRSGTALPQRAALLHIRTGDARAALDALAAEPPSDVVHLIRAAACELTGDRDAARVEYERVWSGDAGPGRLRNRAWAGYRTGRLDEAVGILTELAARQPRNRSFALDLGLMLIVRGDLDGGRRTLHDAVAAGAEAGELAHLADAGIATARADVAGTPHAERARAVLAEVADLAGRRCAALRARTRSTDGAAARAARARTAYVEERYGEAVEHYRGLLSDGAVPEAGLGLRRALEAETAHGDHLLKSGDPDRAQAVWEAALRGATEPPAPAGGFADRLRARIALSGLARGESTAGVLANASRWAGLDPAALSEAMTVVAIDTPSVWRLRDGLRGAGEYPERAELVEAADGVPFTAAYRLDRAAVPDSAVIPLVTPLEIRLAAPLIDLVGTPELRASVAEVRRRLTVRTGVRIPGVRIVADPDGCGDAQATFGVYNQVVDRMPAEPGRPADAAALAARLEKVAQAHLYRLIAPDDVPLWLRGWHDPALPPVDDRVADAPAALRLVRVLRLLLMEAVPITDRVAIVAGFRAAENAASPGSLDTLRTVRHRLPPAVLGAPPGARLEAVPAELELRVARGLSPDRSVWESDRAVAATLVEDLREWRSALPEEVALTVREPEARPYLWRLLTAGGNRDPVLSEEELG